MNNVRMKEPLKLYNTKSRTIEDFKPLHDNSVGIYSCGPTVYHYAHLGNLRAYVFADTLQRAIRSYGYSVKHVINITDVGHLTSDGDEGEDKLEKGSRREGKTAWDVAAFYTDAFMSDITLLGINKDNYIFPRATDTIPEQIAIIESLAQKGFTYTITDGVYFDTSLFPNYPLFARLDTKGLHAGARVEENKEKKNPTDFALWKFSPQGVERQMEWESPWGKGFPGWHIECSAMSKKELGSHFDIHTGGIDHIPVHHTNEIAQSENANGGPYVNYWMHVNFLNDTTGKMSKSHDDFLTLATIIEKGYKPLAYRYFLLTAHYRKEITFSYEALDGASNAYTKLVHFATAHNGASGTILEQYKEQFEQTLYNDLNTPEALAVMWNMLKDQTAKAEDVYTTLMYMNSILGLGLETITILVLPAHVQELLEKRKEARKQKDWTASDTLREKIQALGFEVKDTDAGQSVTLSE